MKNNNIEDQQAVLDVCNMVINNRHVFPDDQVKKAEELREATLTLIKGQNPLKER